jgi:hypothetical protein
VDSIKEKDAIGIREQIIRADNHSTARIFLNFIAVNCCLSQRAAVHLSEMQFIAIGVPCELTM